MVEIYKGYDKIIEPTLLCDFYKVSHRVAYREGTEKIYSTLVARGNKYMPMAENVVVFKIQGFIKEYLLEYFNTYFFARAKEEVVVEYKRVIKYTLGIDNPDSKHIEDLHDLGYLPIKISSLEEGTLVPFGVPILTIENTNKDFYWLTNYLETILSTELWLGITSATMAKCYRDVLDDYAMKTVGNLDGVGFQGHDFSMRGMSSLSSAMSSGAGHLLFFDGTDTIPAIMYLEKYYNANIEKELVASSIPASEHSVMSSGTSFDGDRDEYDMFKRMITEVYPSGFVSIVSDTYDFWRVVSETLPRLKEEIMSRDGRVVIRPDSGNPVQILCGNFYEDLSNDRYVKRLDDAQDYFHDMIYDDERAECGDGFCGEDIIDYEFKYEGKYYKAVYSVDYNRHDKRYYYIDSVDFVRIEEIFPDSSDLGLIECLWNIFGGTVSEKGYKILDSHIGAIYGDSMTYDLIKEICERLEKKGFASTNVVFGLGSYSYQMKTRDSLGLVVKATYSEVNGEPVFLLKDPKTDSGKRSHRGRVFVYKDKDGNIVAKDGLTTSRELKMAEKYEGLLKPVFQDGKLLKEVSLSEIRSRVRV